MKYHSQSLLHLQVPLRPVSTGPQQRMMTLQLYCKARIFRLCTFYNAAFLHYVYA